MEQTKVDTKIFYGDLLDLYGSLLTEKQLTYMKLYFEEDYSLQEIADTFSVSRMAIHKQIQQASKKMLLLEEQLHVCYTHRVFLPHLDQALQTNDIATITKEIKLLQKKMKWSE